MSVPGIPGNLDSVSVKVILSAQDLKCTTGTATAGQQVDRMLPLVHLLEPVFLFPCSHDLVQPGALNPLYFNASRPFLVQLKTSATGGVQTLRWTAGQLDSVFPVLPSG